MRITSKSAGMLIAAALAASAWLPGLAVAGEQQIVVVTSVIYPGQEIEPGMIREVRLKRPLRASQRIVLDTAEIVGKVAQRTLLPRRAIPVAALREPFAVEAGEPTRASYVSGGLLISTMVVPLVDGSIDDMIRVRNPESGRVFTARVLADGTVMVEPTR
ncbi:MAG: flagellar basal body P-ring formation chaperone FlgA [Rhizobiaceae bacterium]